MEILKIIMPEFLNVIPIAGIGLSLKWIWNKIIENTKGL